MYDWHIIDELPQVLLLKIDETAKVNDFKWW